MTTGHSATVSRPCAPRGATVGRRDKIDSTLSVASLIVGTVAKATRRQRVTKQKKKPDGRARLTLQPPRCGGEVTVYPQRNNEARHGAVIKSWVAPPPHGAEASSLQSSRRHLRRRVRRRKRQGAACREGPIEAQPQGTR